MEKPGIEPANPGLQVIGLSPTPRRLPTGLIWDNPGNAFQFGSPMHRSFKSGSYITDLATKLKAHDVITW